MTRVEKLRLAASLCLVGGSVDLAILAGWAWPRVMEQRNGGGASPPALVATGGTPGDATKRAAPVAPPAPTALATTAGSSPAPVPAPATAPGPGAAPVAGVPAASPPAIAAAPPVEDPEPPAAPARAVAEASEGDEPSGGASPSAGGAPVGVFFFRTREGSHWSDPRKSFQRIVDLARREPGLVVEVDGYADHRADRHDNRKLSLRRAHRIATALQSAGFSREQIVVRARGDRAPAPGRGRVALKWHRRVEVHVRERGAS